MLNFNFEEKILEHYYGSYEERARYLKKVYDSEIDGSSFNNKEGKYLDVGSGLGYNTKEFGKDYEGIFSIDNDIKTIKNSIEHLSKQKKIPEKIFYINSDARYLPFRNETFDLISLFSVIEHVPDLELTIKELRRVLKDKGISVIQIPNKYFFLELHTYLPFLYLLPKRIRNKILEILDYSEEDPKEVDIILKFSRKKLLRELKKNKFNIVIQKLIYPPELIPPSFRIPYLILKKLGLFSLIPFGYFIICFKEEEKWKH